MRIGFIGLGIMGRPMALNLIKAGFQLTVYNRTASKCKPLVDAGAAKVSTPGEVAELSDIVITIVSDTLDVESALFDENGMVSGSKEQQIVIDMSSITPSATQRFASRLRERRVEMLDAPVTGGEKGAIEGTLAIMVGGRRETFDKCLPILQSMGGTIVYTGQSGTGQKTK